MDSYSTGMSSSIDELAARYVIEEKLTRQIEDDQLGLITLNPTQYEYICSLSRETMLWGPNQVAGKSTSSCVASTWHLTGDYPDYYTGRRFDKPIIMGIGGVSHTTTRNLLTDRLLGDSKNRGSGYIPGKYVKKNHIAMAASGIPNQVDFFDIPHHTNGVYDGMSRCYVFSFKSGWKSVMGYPLDLAVLDEEPEWILYDQFSARLNYTRGIMLLSMTPENGRSKLVRWFEDTPDPKLRRRIKYGIDQCTHLTEEHRQEMKVKYANHPLAAARLRGEPVAGEGHILPFTMDQIGIQPIAVPRWWPAIIGIDINHGPTGVFAATKLFHDTENDEIYQASGWKLAGKERPVIADRLKSIGGDRMPVAYPHDTHRRVGDGAGAQRVADIYRGFGINMLPDPAYREDSDGGKTNETMPILDEMYDYMSSGRWHTFVTIPEFFDEVAEYKMIDGRIKRDQDDHMIDATVKAVMCLDQAEIPAAAGTPGDGRAAMLKRAPLNFYGRKR